MRPLFLFLLSFIYVFGACAPSYISKVDGDGFLHCIKRYPPETTNMLYITNISSITKPETIKKEKVIVYKDDNIGSNELKNRINFKSVVGGMDVIGASVIKPIDAQGGYNFDPTVIASPLAKKEFVQEDLSLFSSTSKFKNSSSAIFTFNDKSQYERDNINGKKIKYARLYWGGSIYKPWAETNLNTITDKFLDVISGYSSVKFKTPNGVIHSVKADIKDVKWTSSFSSGNEYVITPDSLPPAGSNNTAGRAGLYFVYQASADVTQILKDLKAQPIAQSKFTVGQIASSIETLDRYKFDLNYRDKNNKPQTKNLTSPYGAVLYGDGQWNSALGVAQFGGWSLVIVYDLGAEGEEKGVKTKAINLYDGMVNINPKYGATTEDSRQIYYLTFSDFYTPRNGAINSTLSFLGFGGRAEVEGENIAINKNGFKSVYKSPLNPDRKQFNSTITRFGEHANSSKKYNAQMDLDIFDISDLVTNKQNELELRLEATGSRPDGGTYNGDRINIGMIALSTEVYKPEVCYMEDIYIKKLKNTNDKKHPKEYQDFYFTKIEPNTPDKPKVTTTIVPADTILTTIVYVKNIKSEDTENFALKATTDLNRSYVPKTTYIVADGSFTNNPLGIIKKENYNEDNTYLQKLDSNSKELTFFLGRDAAANKGGKILHSEQNHAYAIYDTNITSGSYFNETNYRANVVNEDIGLSAYNTSIKKCTPYSYSIYVNEPEPNNFIPSSKKDDGSENFKNKYKNRLLTQIVTKPFDVYITNYGKDGKKRAPDSPVDVKVELVESCGASTNLYEKNIEFNVNSDFLLPSIKVDMAYKSLKFRISHPNPKKKTDPAAPEKITACENLDDFAVRPSHFMLFDDDASTSLIGGKIYNNITLAAMKPKPNDSSTADGYTNIIDANLTVENNATCERSFLNNDNKLIVHFTNKSKAIGKIIRHTSSGDVGFSYSDIGDTTFNVIDNNYTRTDQSTSHGYDCVKDSSENDPTKDPEGRVGCNIKFDKKDFKFAPKDLDVSEFKIIPSDFSYISNEETAWSPTLNFKVKARLFDDNPALLYKNGCYSNNTTFKIKAGEIIAEYTDNNGSKLSNDEAGVEKLNSEIMFFGSSDPNALVKKVNLSPHDGTYQVKKEAFGTDGTAWVNLKFNFKREKNMAKNPFEVASDIFTFVSLVDSKENKNNGHIKPTNKTSAKFYYGRVYAPYYEGPNTGFKAKIYYGVYCNGCDESKFMLQNIGSSERWSEFAGTHSWYINPLHSSAYGDVGKYEFLNKTIRDNSKERALSNGVSYIFVKNKRAVTDVAKMHTDDWLIYNEFDKDAKTNDFNLRFLVPDGDWAGKTLGKNSNSGDVGIVLGAEGNFTDISKNTNRRISW